MDYSLLLAVRHDADRGATAALGGADRGACHRRLVVREGDAETVYALGIIDFLQKWTSMKQVARAVKCLEREKATIPPQMYGDRFVERFEKRLLEADDLLDDFSALPTPLEEDEQQEQAKEPDKTA